MYSTTKAYCTIITSDYFFYAQTIFDSLYQFDKTLKFEVLIVDELDEIKSYKNINVCRLNQIKASLKEDYQLIKKYESDKQSTFRWALKPLFLKYLLQIEDYQKVLFVDPDLYFYNSPTFLFDELDVKDFLLTPHWRSKDPFLDRHNFDILFTEGLYNAGFVGCNKNSMNILNWWLKVCSYKMEKSSGFYVDQGYLNLMPLYFPEQIKVLQHKGCNVSNWNMLECQRSENNGAVLINNKFPVIFIHYTNATINNILDGKDKVLTPFLETYKSSLLKHHPGVRFNYEKKSTVKMEKNIINMFKAFFLK